LRAWLAQIVRRNVIDHSRSFGDARRRSVATREVSWSDAIEGSLVAAGESPSGLIRQAELDQELISAMALLPPHYRSVIEMRHRDGLAYAEIAMRCSISVEAARKLWTRAIRQLQQFLGTAHEGQRIRCQ
jgi:RNA polymerase sigma-70 factor (ECF subfamily)